MVLSLAVPGVYVGAIAAGSFNNPSDGSKLIGPDVIRQQRLCATASTDGGARANPCPETDAAA
jgi:hypothetical protein